jgi:hypothetical protein
MSQTAATKKFIQEIEKGFRGFDRDEISHYNEDILVAFAEKRATFFLHYLPKSLKTDRLLSVIAETDKTNQCMRYISKNSTPIYRELASKAVASSYGNLTYVSKEVVDSDFIRETSSRAANSLYGFFEQYPDLVHQTFSTTEMEAVLWADKKACNQVVNGVLRGSIKTPLITDEFIQKSLLVCPSLISFIRKTERNHLALDLLNQGEWPEAFASDKPTDLKDAVKRMMKPKNSSVQNWQIAYAMTFGIAEVVKAMKTPSRIELLEEIYPKEEILPFLSNRQGMKIKGQWLEDSLGL